MSARRAMAGLALAGALSGCALFEHAEPTIITGGETPTLIPDVPFVVSSEPTVAAMLDLAGVRKGDVVYDLGCGDGRIVIAAALRGARGVGIDIDPFPLEFARRNVREAGVEDRVRFVRGDFFEASLADATVVMLYLSPRGHRPPAAQAACGACAGQPHRVSALRMAGKPDRVVQTGSPDLSLWVPTKGARFPLTRRGPVSAGRASDPARRSASERALDR